MLGKHRLAVGIPYWRPVFDLTARKEIVWTMVPPFLLALAFLSLVLLQEPARGPISPDMPVVTAPVVADELYSHYADWQQTDGSYLSYRSVLR